MLALRVAKDAAAFQALIIVEDALIERLAELGAGNPAGRAADQTTQNCAGDATERHSDRTANSADGRTELGATEGPGCTGRGSAYGADRAAGFPGHVTCRNTCGLTIWTLMGHD